MAPTEEPLPLRLELPHPNQRLFDGDAADFLMALYQGLQTLLVAQVVRGWVKLALVKTVASVDVLVIEHAAEGAVRGLPVVAVGGDSHARGRVDVRHVSLYVLEGRGLLCLLVLILHLPVAGHGAAAAVAAAPQPLPAQV